MTRSQLRRWRERQNLTQRQAGMWYGLSAKSAERTWRRWENGERTIPRPLVQRIKALDDNGEK